MGHCQVLSPRYPLQGEAAVVGNQQGLPCGSIITITGQELVVDSFQDRPHSIQILHLHRKGPSTYEAMLWDHPQQSTVLTKCGLPKSPCGLTWHQSSIDSMPQEVVVDISRDQTPATSNSTLSHALTGKCKNYMPNTYGGGWGIIETIDENREKISNCWLEPATVRWQIRKNDHLSCGVGIWVVAEQRRGRISLGSSHRCISWQFQPTGCTINRSISILLPQGV